VSELAPAARVARTDDRSAVVDTIVDAFASDPLVRWFFPGEDFERRAAAFFGYLFDIRVGDGEVYVADGAASMWSPPGGVSMDPDEQDRLWRSDVVEGAGPGEIARIDAFDEAVDAVRLPGNHRYLGVLGTRPERRGLGLATAVLEPGLRGADREGMPCFLETGTAENLAFYERFGFEVLAETTVPDGPVIWALVRRPRDEP
jgi:GNAT superfamily N-acetyltransferase